jgi:hypothetical protein
MLRLTGKPEVIVVQQATALKTPAWGLFGPRTGSMSAMGVLHQPSLLERTCAIGTLPLVITSLYSARLNLVFPQDNERRQSAVDA